VGLPSPDDGCICDVAVKTRIKDLAAGTNQLPKLIVCRVRLNDSIEVIHVPANRAA